MTLGISSCTSDRIAIHPIDSQGDGRRRRDVAVEVPGCWLPDRGNPLGAWRARTAQRPAAEGAAGRHAANQSGAEEGRHRRVHLLGAQ